MVKNISFDDLKRRNQNKEFSFPFSVGSSPDPSTEKLIVRKNSLVLVPSGARQRGGQNHHAIGAYGEVQSHHALGACEDQSLRDCSKWVRATRNNSSKLRIQNRLEDRAFWIWGVAVLICACISVLPAEIECGEEADKRYEEYKRCPTRHTHIMPATNAHTD